MNKNTLILFLFLFSIILKSENISDLYSKVDSLYYTNSIECITFAKKLEKLSKKTNNDTALARAYYIQASVHYKNKNYNKSIRFFEKELSVSEKTAKTIIIAESFYNLGSTCLKLNKNRKAKNYFEKSIELSKKINDIDLLYANHNALFIVNEKSRNYKEALDALKYIQKTNEGEFNNVIGLYKEKYFEQKHITNTKKQELSNIKDELDTTTNKLVETKNQVYSLEEDTLRKNLKINSLKFQKLINEYDLKAKKEELKQQRRITFLFIGGFSIILALSVFLLKIFMSKKKINKELVVQKDKIIKQNKQITESIRYARRIQEASLPSESVFADNFSEYFIIFKPKHIVSGDFYFFRKVNDYIVFAAVDCTGHGVPGAFLSMLGIAFLNDIVRQKRVTKASHILDCLRENVKQQLNQTGKKGEQKDGMDMAVCIIDTSTNMMQFAGAHNPLILIRNGEIHEFKGDRMPVGIHRKEKDFTNHSFDLQKDDKVYMYSDGFPDQLGGEHNKKYKSKHFKSFLLKTSNTSLEMQKNNIEDEYNKWKANSNQIDDIVILGVKI